jgi:hypothetical protein
MQQCLLTANAAIVLIILGVSLLLHEQLEQAVRDVCARIGSYTVLGR